MQDIFTMFNTWNKTVTAQADINKYFTEGLNAYNNDFLRPLLTATEIFNNIESTKIWQRTLLENVNSYLKLLGSAPRFTLWPEILIMESVEESVRQIYENKKIRAAA
jgi:hypothetical protein